MADLPGLDCGSCGSPSCRALAEDIALGFAVELDCIFKLKTKLQQMSRQMVDISETTRIGEVEYVRSRANRETGC